MHWMHAGKARPPPLWLASHRGGPLAPAVNSDSVLNVSVLEAAALEDLDPEAVKTGLAQYTAAYASATDDYAKSEAEIGVETYQAMSYAIADGA
jgi:hypothetical protein